MTNNQEINTGVNGRCTYGCGRQGTYIVDFGDEGMELRCGYHSRHRCGGIRTDREVEN